MATHVTREEFISTFTTAAVATWVEHYLVLSFVSTAYFTVKIVRFSDTFKPLLQIFQLIVLAWLNWQMSVVSVCTLVVSWWLRRRSIEKPALTVSAEHE